MMAAASPEPPFKAQPPAVSVGLPVHNGGRYIEAAIESILAQTFGKWELIIADDSSTDQTAEICRRYASYESRNPIPFQRQAARSVRVITIASSN